MHSYRRIIIGSQGFEPINTSNYLTMVALEDDFTFSFTNDVEYCLNGIGNWKTLSAETTSPSLKTGDMVSLRATLTPDTNAAYPIGTFFINKKCDLTGTVMSLLFGDNAGSAKSLSGKSYAFKGLFYDCTKIINVSSTFLPATTLSTHCYENMFYGCVGLKTAPALPATTLISSCYSHMFSGCVALTTAPALPATTLAGNCYEYMFNMCSNLTSAPALPATTLATSCYAKMFNSCIKLTTAPALPATTLKDYCYDQMFGYCTRLTSAPALNATTLASYCYYNMFAGCSGLTTAPVLPATTLKTGCYYGMFMNCTGLTTAPVLPATTLVTYCYCNMFNGCSKLNYIKANFTTTPSSTYTASWVANVASTGTFVKSRSASWNVTGNNGVPTGWTVKKPVVMSNYLNIKNEYSGTNTVKFSNALQYSTDEGINWFDLAANTGLSLAAGKTIIVKANITPVSTSGCGIFTVTYDYSVSGDPRSLLFGDNASSATTLPEYAFSWLFGYNSNLKSANLVFGNVVSNHCYDSMFYNCKGLTSLPATQLPATTLATACYIYMFYGCSGLTTIPNNFLPATILADDCYEYMFQNCTSLTSTPTLSATSLKSYCYSYMFYGCTALTSAPSLPATTLANSCYYNMFKGCTKLTSAPALPATTLATYCYYNMFSGCSSLTTAPALPATTLQQRCYYNMFNGCTKLTSAPELPATTLTTGCYNQMFYGCSKLNYIKANFTTTPGTGYTENWVYGVASTGTFEKNPNASWDVTGVHGVPTGWTVEQDIPFNPDNYLKITNTYSIARNLWIYASETDSTVRTAQYTTDGNSWKTLTSTTSIPANSSIYVKANFADSISSWYNTYGTCGYHFVCNSDTNSFAFSGNIMSLLYGDFASTRSDVPAYAFYSLFDKDHSNITISSIYNSSTEYLKLLATTLATACYAYMFYGQENFTSCHKNLLPATTLANECYYGMFGNCSGLTGDYNSAIRLPATTLTAKCYANMFQGTSISDASNILHINTTLADECCAYMFGDCKSLTTGPVITITNTTLPKLCYSYMFSGCSAMIFAPSVGLDTVTTCNEKSCQHMFQNCTKLMGAPVLSATSIGTQAYLGMFKGCTSLTTSPVLPATTGLASGCYNSMFYGCSKLNYITADLLVTPGTSYTQNWVYGVASTGTFVKNPNATWNVTGVHGVPTNWTIAEPFNESNYLTFEAVNESTIKFANALQYTLDNGVTWLNLNANTSITLAAGKKMSFRANYGNVAPNGPGRFTITGGVNVSGNVLSLLYGDSAADYTSLPDYACYSLFSGLSHSPNAVLSVSNNLFSNITSVGEGACMSMFQYCTSLTNTPKLPATTLGSMCYSNMFKGCSSLKTAPTLPAITLSSSCYYNMFAECTSLTTVPELPATTLASYCYSHMFDGCTNLTTVPSILPATTLASYCYQYMFNNCTWLITAPELPATTLASYCYNSMFMYCSRLNYIKMLATDISASNCLNNWVYNVASTGTFVKNPNATWNVTGVNGVPTNWTITYSGNTGGNTSTASVKVRTDLTNRWSEQSAASFNPPTGYVVWQSTGDTNKTCDRLTIEVSNWNYINNGSFTIYIRGNAGSTEKNYDYTVAFALDKSPSITYDPNSTSQYSYITYNTTNVAGHTRGTSGNGLANNVLNSYVAVTYSIPDDSTHTIEIYFRRDTSTPEGPGIVLIPSEYYTTA